MRSVVSAKETVRSAHPESLAWGRPSRSIGRLRTLVEVLTWSGHSISDCRLKIHMEVTAWSGPLVIVCRQDSHGSPSLEQALWKPLHTRVEVLA